MSNKTNPYAFLEVNSDVEEEPQPTTTVKVQVEKPEKRDRKPSNELIKIHRLKAYFYRR